MESYSGVSEAISRKGVAYIDGLYGSEGVIATLRRLGMEQKEFQRINKISATIVANNARKLAPVETGVLRMNIKGYASKKVTQNNNPPKFIFGGVVVVTAQRRARRGERASIKAGTSNEIIGYAKRISFGMYRSPSKTKDGNFFRQQANPYLRNGRNSARPAIIAMWNRELSAWLNSQGIGKRHWEHARWVKMGR